jgi:antitoxin MazE
MYIQEAAVQVERWGESLAVRLPADLVAELGIEEGDELEIVRASPGCLGVRLKKKPPTPEEREAAIQRLRALRGKLRGGDD